MPIIVDRLVWWTGQSDASIIQRPPHPSIGILTLLVSHVAHAKAFANNVRKLFASESIQYSIIYSFIGFSTFFLYFFKVVLMRMDSTDSIGATKATSYQAVIMLVKKIQ